MIVIINTVPKTNRRQKSAKDSRPRFEIVKPNHIFRIDNNGGSESEIRHRDDTQYDGAIEKNLVRLGDRQKKIVSLSRSYYTIQKHGHDP